MWNEFSTVEGLHVFNYYIAAEPLFVVKDENDFIAALGQGCTISLHNDIALTSNNSVSALTITQPTIIHGNGYTISTNAHKKIFEVYNDLTIENITLENSYYQGRCIDTRTDNITVNLNNCTLIADNTSNT
jgi:hypothetical protein